MSIKYCIESNNYHLDVTKKDNKLYINSHTKPFYALGKFDILINIDNHENFDIYSYGIAINESLNELYNVFDDVEGELKYVKKILPTEMMLVNIPRDIVYIIIKSNVSYLSTTFGYIPIRRSGINEESLKNILIKYNNLLDVISKYSNSRTKNARSA